MKSRIAFVSQPGAWCGPPQPQGSIEIWTHEVARRLTPMANIRVYLPSARVRSVVEHHDGVEYHHVSAVFDRITTTIHRLVRRRRPSPFTVWQSLGYCLRVAVGIAHFRPDIVHIQNQFPFVRVIRLINRRVPVVLHSHGDWLTTVNRANVAPALELVDRIVTPSDHVADAFRSHWPERSNDCVRVPNGVDAAWLDRFETIEPPVSEILFVGRLSPEKGIHDLLSAFEVVAEHHPEVVLTCVGPTRAVAPRSYLVELSDDPLVRRLDRFYGERPYADILRESIPVEIRDRVRFVPNMPHDELLEVYRRATLLVNPSLVESFGMSVVEAMATGTPVVVTDVGGMPEIVAGGIGGLVVPPGDVEALADAMLSLLSNPARREELGTSGRARVASRYTWELVSQDIGFVYSGIEDGARTKQVIGKQFAQMVDRAVAVAPADMHGRTLVLAPHPDDETLGCGGTIAALTAAGREVGVAFLTDGGLSGPGDRQSTTDERMAEARAACDLLGVKPAHVWMFGLPDGGLHRHQATAADQLSRVIEEFGPVRMFVPHRHDGHPDHEAAYRIALRAASSRSESIAIFEYAIWLWNNWPWTPAPLPFTLDRSELKRAVRSWRSAWRSWRRRDLQGLDHAVDVQSTSWRKRAALELYATQLPSLAAMGRGRFLRWFATSHELFRHDRSA